MNLTAEFWYWFFIGLILFTVFLREVVLITYKNIYSLNLILSLTLFLVIENLFHRQLGSFILALTIVIAVHIINSQNEKMAELSNGYYELARYLRYKNYISKVKVTVHDPNFELVTCLRQKFKCFINKK